MRTVEQLMHKMEKVRRGTKTYAKAKVARDATRTHGRSAPKNDPLVHLTQIRANLSRFKYRAESVGIPFNLEYEDIEWVARCPATGVRIDYTGADTDRGWTLDRLDPLKPYTRHNVYVISRRALRIKNGATLQEIEGIAAWMKKVTKVSAARVHAPTYHNEDGQAGVE